MLLIICLGISAILLFKLHAPGFVQKKGIFHFPNMDQPYAGQYQLFINPVPDICRIFLWYLRRMEENGISMYGSSNIRAEDIVRLNAVLDYIHENYMQPVLAEKMAKMCNMSYSYFSRFFRHALGQTFSDYLLYVRLTEAEKLLITTSKSISQIALDTGLSESSVRKYIGRARKQIRKMLGEEGRV